MSSSKKIIHIYDKKGLALDFTGWMILGLIGLVVAIGLVILFSGASIKLINVIP